MENLKNILLGEQTKNWKVPQCSLRIETLQNSFEKAETKNNNHSSTNKPMVQFWRSNYDKYL
jgi:hypothetical protein